MKESIGENQVREGSPAQRYHRFMQHHPRVRWFAIFGTFVMVLSSFSGVAHASSPQQGDPLPPYSLPLVNGFHSNPAYATVGQTVYFFANVTGGDVSGGSTVGSSSPAAFLETSGYHVLWFFGGANATGDINEKTINVPAPSGCLPPVRLCKLNSPITANYTYQTPGSYNVSITVYDANFNFTIATTTVVVSYSGFSVLIQSPCDSPEYPGQACTMSQGEPILINTDIEFNANKVGTTDGVLYRWDFGDGNVSYAQYAHHDFARNGTYIVSVTATDISTGEAARAFLNVLVTLLTVTVCPFAPQYGTVGVPVQFGAGISDPNPGDYHNLTAAWGFGDGTSGMGLNTTHIFTSPGTYGADVTSISDLNVNPPFDTCGLHTPTVVVNGTLSAKQGKGVTVPVGQVAFTNALNYTNAPQGSALLNYSWSANTGSSFGVIGRTPGFKVQNESVSLTVNDPYASPGLQTSTYANFTDVKPTVGVDSLYTEAGITVSIGNTYYAENVTIVLLENGKNVSWYNLWWYNQSVTFQLIDFQMANQWSLVENYTPYGSLGSSSVTTAFSWTACNSYGCYLTQNVQVSHTFYNSNPPSQDNYQISINKEARGQWAFPTVVLFSPAQTSFYETDSFGFGTTQHYNDTAPAVAEPTLDTYPWAVDWASGKNYTYNVTACDAWGMCGSSAITVYDQYNFSVSDTAPTVTAPVQSPAYSAVPGTLNTFVANITSNVPANESTVSWQFGDGGSAKSTGVGASSSATHVYQYGARYAVVVYASSPSMLGIHCSPACGGETSANWSWITVSNIKPEPAFSISNATPLVYQAVTFDGSRTVEDGQMSLANLAFSWNFGDGSIAQGYGLAGDIVSHYYAAAGTYTVILTVQNRDGVDNTSSGTVTVGSTPPSFSFPTRSMTVDSYTVFKAPYPDLTSSPFVQVNWAWGDGNHTLGFGAGHTYLMPGNYTATLTLSGGVFGAGSTKTSVVTATDVPLTVVLPYGNYVAYGENHTESFPVYTLGSYVDSNPVYYNLGVSYFTWQWGDGSGNSSTFNFGNSSMASHHYNLTGIFDLSVLATSPFTSWYASTGTGTVSINSVPDSDGDGLPNAYETAVTDTNPYWPDSAAKSPSYNGTGLTDYVGPYLTAIGNLTADPDSDGLTSLQEIMGSVTGFPSNPLDPNTAGDGIPDGSHFFSESFRNDNVTSFGTPTNISGVWYAGPAKSFHEADLLVQVNTATSPLSNVLVSLTTPGGDLVPLGGMTSNPETFVVVTSTPTGGEKDPYGIGLTQFTQAGTWKVGATGGTGQILEANLALSYYTNPSLADPTHQGLIQGHGITIPILNCSEPSNITYPVFDPSTWKITQQPFFPYTEQYYKLSEQQGIPYVSGSNQSVAKVNWAAYNASSSCPNLGVDTNLLGDTASYLGDADFGISPWVSDVTGDWQPNGLPLTNGMKALGAAVYNSMRDNYLNYSGNTFSSRYTGYVNLPDTLAYTAPLNPTVKSTQFDGARDGYTMGSTLATTTPLSLAVTITSATDVNCYVPNPVDEVSATLSYTQGGSPTIFSAKNYSSAHASPAGCPTYDYNDFSFNDHYTMPLNNSQSEFNLTFVLWHNADPSGDDKGSWTFTGFVYSGFSGSFDNTNGGQNTGVNVAWSVEPTPRAPVVLVSNAGETEQLPGYGLHYVGEQQFYGFYLGVTGNTSGPNDPFQPGGSQGALNVILISRASYLYTNLSTNLSANTLAQNLPAVASCLGNSNVTTRNSGGSQLGLAGTFSGTMSDTCANLLLTNLMPRNSTGNVTGTYQALDSTQVQLLGFDADTSQLAPFLPIAGFNSPFGPSPDVFSLVGSITGLIGSVTGSVGVFFVAVGTYFDVPALVALGNFIANLPAEVAALGQIVLGVLTAVYNAVQAAAAWAANILNVLVQLVLSIMKAIAQAVIGAMLSIVDPIKNDLALDSLSFSYRENLTSLAQFNSGIAVLDPGYSGLPLQLSDIDLHISTDTYFVLAAAAGLIAGVIIANWLATATTDGAYRPIGYISQEVAKAYSEASVATTLGVVSSVLSVALLSGPSSEMISSQTGISQSFLTALGIGGSVATAVSALAAVAILFKAFRTMQVLTVGAKATALPGLVFSLASGILAAGFNVLGVQAAAHLGAVGTGGQEALVAMALMTSFLSFGLNLFILLEPPTNLILEFLGVFPIDFSALGLSVINCGAAVYQAINTP